MPSVAVTTTATQPVLLPRICAKTGVPTDDMLRLRGSAAPEWTILMIFFGLFAWLVAQTMSSRRYDIVVPFDSTVLRTYRKWRRVAWSCGGLGVVLTIALTLMAPDMGGYAVTIVVAVFLVALVLGLGNEWANSVGVRLSREGTLVLTRVHPRFRAAVLGGDRSQVRS